MHTKTFSESNNMKDWIRLPSLPKIKFFFQKVELNHRQRQSQFNIIKSKRIIKPQKATMYDLFINKRKIENKMKKNKQTKRIRREFLKNNGSVQCLLEEEIRNQ